MVLTRAKKQHSDSKEKKKSNTKKRIRWIPVPNPHTLLSRSLFLSTIRSWSIRSFVL